MRTLTILFFSVAAFKLERLPNAPIAFIPNAAFAFLPYRIAQHSANDTFHFRAECASPTFDVKDCAFEARGTAANVNRALAERLAAFGAATKGNVTVSVVALKEGSDERHSDERTLSAIEEIGLEAIVRRTDAFSVFPLRIARVSLPFERAALKLRQSDGKGFKLTLFNGNVELELSERTANGEIRFSLFDEKTGLNSAEIAVEVARLRTPNEKFVLGALVAAAIACICALVASTLLLAKFKFEREAVA